MKLRQINFLNGDSFPVFYLDSAPIAPFTIKVALVRILLKRAVLYLNTTPTFYLMINLYGFVLAFPKTSSTLM